MRKPALPPPILTPEDVVDRVNALKKSIQTASVSAKKRRELRDNNRASRHVLRAEIELIGASDVVEQALGITFDEAEEKMNEADRWMTAEREIAALHSGVSGANLVRRDDLKRLGAHAYAIASSLSRTPAGKQLLPRVTEIRRLRNAGRKKAPRKKARSGEET